MHDVVIVGAGFAGLFTGVELTRRGLDVAVVEAAHEPGGVAATVRDSGYLFEPAAGAVLLPHPHLTPILTAAGVPLAATSDAVDTRLVHTGDGLVAAPLSPKGALTTRLVSRRGKLRVALEPFVRTKPASPDEALEATMRRRLGDEVGHLAATLMAHGIVAGHPSLLSTSALFPIITELEQDAGSITRGMVRRLRSRPKGAPKVRPRPHVHQDGMVGIAGALAGHLGDRVHVDWEAKEVRHDGGRWVVRGPSDLEARSVVLTVAPHIAAGLVDPAWRATLTGARTAPVAVVALGGPAASLPLPPAFGFLTAPGSPLRALGVVFDSNFADGRAPAGHHLAKAIYGGDADPAVLALDDDDLADLCRDEIGRALGCPVHPTWQRVHRVVPGIPQYRVGHRAWLAAVDDLAASTPGLHVGGWAYRGVGLSGLAQDAVRIADSVVARATR